MSSVVAQVSRRRVSVLDEIVLRHATTRGGVRASFTKRFADTATGIVVYGDASGATPQTTGSSDYAIMRAFFRANGRVPRGVSGAEGKSLRAGTGER